MQGVFHESLYFPWWAETSYQGTNLTKLQLSSQDNEQGLVSAKAFSVNVNLQQLNLNTYQDSAHRVQGKSPMIGQG